MNIERKPHSQSQPLSCFFAPSPTLLLTGIGIPLRASQREESLREMVKMLTVLAVLAEWGIEALVDEADMSQAAFM